MQNRKNFALFAIDHAKALGAKYVDVELFAEITPPSLGVKM